MVMFGPVALPHVLSFQIQTAREEMKRTVPYRNIAYRVDHTTHGRTLNITGEIRETSLSDVYMRIDQLRRLNDGTSRSLDLQDGQMDVFNAKLVDPEYDLAVGDCFNTGRCYVPYTVTFLEVA